MLRMRTGLLIAALAVAIGFTAMVGFGVRDVVADWSIFGYVQGNGSTHP
jgi:hypothetical protein